MWYLLLGTVYGVLGAWLMPVVVPAVHLMDGAASCSSHECVSLRHCPAMLQLVQSRHLRDRRTLMRAICGYQGVDAKVCCGTSDAPNVPPTRADLVPFTTRHTPPEQPGIAIITPTPHIINTNTINATTNNFIVNTTSINITHNTITTTISPVMFTDHRRSHINFQSILPSKLPHFTPHSFSSLHPLRPSRPQHLHFPSRPVLSSPSGSPNTQGCSPCGRPNKIHSRPNTTHSRPASKPDKGNRRPDDTVQNRPLSSNIIPHTIDSIPHRQNTSDIRPVLVSRPNDFLWPSKCGSSIEGFRIYGGTQTELSAYPWMAAIGYTNLLNPGVQFRCSGALISERYVITAAHCLDPREIGDRIPSVVRLGEWRMSTAPDCDLGVCAPHARDLGVSAFTVHPKYSKRFRFSDDIALIRLNTSTTFTRFVSPLCLPPTMLPDLHLNESVVVTGWGLTEAGQFSDTLLKLQMSLVNPRICNRLFPRHFSINGEQLCIGGRVGEDTCAGDSGGPVMKVSRYGSYYILGVTSFGSSKCGRNNYPGVYTSVSSYVQWIKDSVRL